MTNIDSNHWGCGKCGQAIHRDISSSEHAKSCGKEQHKMSFTQKQMRATEQAWQDHLNAYIDLPIDYIFKRALHLMSFSEQALKEHKNSGSRVYSSEYMIWQYERRYGFYNPSYNTD